MGTPIDFWELLRVPHRTVGSWRYEPATGRPVWVAIGRLTGERGGQWFVLVSRPGFDSLICPDERAARRDLHNQGVTLMEVCGPGRWVPREV